MYSFLFVGFSLFWPPYILDNLLEDLALMLANKRDCAAAGLAARCAAHAMDVLLQRVGHRHVDHLQQGGKKGKEKRC